MNYLKIFFKDSQNCYIIWARISANKTIFHNLGQHKYFVNWIKWLWHENGSRSYWNMGDPYRLNINIMTYILYKLVYNISRKTANIWNWSFTNLFLVITDQYWLRKCRTYLILPWCSLERDIFVFLLKNFVMNFIVVPRRLLLSSQNSDHLLSLTLAKFLYAISVYLQAFVENILLFYLYLSQ